MKESLLQRLCTGSRVVPQVPFAAHTPQSTLRYADMDYLSNASLAHTSSAAATSAGDVLPLRTRPTSMRSSVVVLGVFCSVRRPRWSRLAASSALPTSRHQQQQQQQQQQPPPHENSCEEGGGGERRELLPPGKRPRSSELPQPHQCQPSLFDASGGGGAQNSHSGGGGGAVGSAQEDLVLKRCRLEEEDEYTDVKRPSQQPPRLSADKPHTEEAEAVQDEKEERRVYVRVQFDEVLVETLPLEVMRERHPQVLIDFLLSTALWK